MKKFIAFAALAAAITSPVMSQAAPQHRQDVVVGNQNVGADPDANIRFDLEREAGTRNGSFRSSRSAVRMKAPGVSPGLLRLFLQEGEMVHARALPCTLETGARTGGPPW